MNQLVLVTVSGQDQPGITAKLMECIVKNGCSIDDMGQSVTHGLLSLSILIDFPNDQDGPLLKDLLFESKKMGMTLDFDVIDDVKTVNPVGDRYILSAVALEGISAKFLNDVANLFAKNKINIQRIDNVSDSGFKSLDIASTAATDVNWDQVKKDLITISNDHLIDVAFIKDNVFRRNKRLIVFDMDSTLIQTEVIDELAEVFGVGEKVKAVTAKAMNGEIDFNDSLKERVSCLKGLKEEKLKEVLDKLPLTDGVEEFIKTVKSVGYKTAVISGGFTFFANALKEKLGLDYAFANELDFKDGVLTGNVNGTIVNAEHKAFLVDFIAQQEGIHLEQVVAIGDGANDLPMLAKAGLGIAYHAKPYVKEVAQNQMGHGPMTSILYFLGIPGSKDYSQL